MTTDTSAPSRLRPAALPPTAFDLLGGTGRRALATRRLNQRLGAATAAIILLALSAVVAADSGRTAAENQADALSARVDELTVAADDAQLPSDAAQRRADLRDLAATAATTTPHSRIITDLTRILTTVGARPDAITFNDTTSTLQVTGLIPDLTGLGQISSQVLAAHGPAANGWAASIDVAYSPTADAERFTVTIGLASPDGTTGCAQLAPFADPTWDRCPATAADSPPAADVPEAEIPISGESAADPVAPPTTPAGPTTETAQ